MPIDQILPYEFNTKKHSPEQIQKLAAHIHAVGWDVPIVLDCFNVIIKGHARLEAGRLLGYTELDCVIRDDLSAVEVRQARIADNKLAESPWDTEMLSLELQSLGELGIDLGQMGYTMDDLSSLGVYSELPTSPSDTFEDIGPKEFDGSIADDVRTHTCPACGDLHPAT